LDPLAAAVAQGPPPGVCQRDWDLGRYVLETARRYSMEKGGWPDGFRQPLLDCIWRRENLRTFNEAIQSLQTIFMPRYEERLFEYYRSAEYLLLLSFLSYPFAGLASHVEPFVAAAAELDRLDILDYGAGIPFGIIHLLRTCPGKVRSVTVVDLDLVHTAFAEYLLRGLAPNTLLDFHKLRDTESVPDFGARTFNLLYGKDIFEHLRRPEPVFHALLSHSAQPCLGFFDLRHHGERYLQHVTPDVTHLVKLATDHAFEPAGLVAGLSAFRRGAAGQTRADRA
jgi:hypothetical protein